MAEAHELSASLPCEPVSDSNIDVVKSIHTGKGGLNGVRNQGPFLVASASVEDLSALDMEKETREGIDESSPRGVLEVSIRSTESETSSSKASTSYSEAPVGVSVATQWRGFLKLWKQKPMRRLYTFPVLGFPRLSKKSGRSTKDNIDNSSPLFTEEVCYVKPSWKNLALAELRAATDNFSSENVIGKGGYGEVYKGRLQDGQLVAIKRLTRGSVEERTSDFLSELGVIVHVNHPNAAKLIGFGIEGGMHLVLELSPHGSLASVLHGSEQKLSWSVRYKVALGTAEGLLYLHEHCQRRIIHRDIKAANILLTEDYEPQICDFGLAKWLPDQWTHHTVSKFEGTFGYLAPEYFMHGIIDEKTDVYAFGVLLLELISGRRVLDSSKKCLVMWAKPLIEKNDVRELIDPCLSDAYDAQQLNSLVLAASLSIQCSSLLRPSMSQVLQILKGEISTEKMKLIRRRNLQRTYSEELLDVEEYNSTRYFKDLNRHRQLAMEFEVIHPSEGFKLQTFSRNQNACQIAYKAVMTTVSSLACVAGFRRQPLAKIIAPRISPKNMFCNDN